MLPADLRAVVQRVRNGARGQRHIRRDTTLPVPRPVRSLRLAAQASHSRVVLVERILEDEDLMTMHDLAEKDGIEEPAGVAAKLGWPRERVYNANARLRRHRDEVVRQVKAELSGGPHE